MPGPIIDAPAPAATAVPAGPHGINYHHDEAARPATGYAFFMPTLSLVGPGSLSAAAAQISNLGVKKALIVCGKFMVTTEHMQTVKDMLAGIGVEVEVWPGCTPNPTAEEVADGVAALKATGCDFLVSFGGGSPHDCAKAIGMVATNGGSIKDYEGVDKTTVPMLPLVAINTTAGTAAEMTRFSIITDTQRKVKMAIIDSKCTPSLAVDDPLLMVGMPPSLTAATGMDALTHAIEAYVSTISNPLTDAAALHAMRLIAGYLRTAVHDPTNIQARDMMSYAQYLAGAAFNSASLGYVHAMAHQLGGVYDLPHGVCNAVLLPAVQEYNAQAVPHLFIDIAEALGCKPAGLAPAKEAPACVAAVLSAIRQLSRDVGIPPNLEALGVKPEDFDLLAENAMSDACGLTNPKQPTKEEVVGMFRAAYEQTGL